MKSTLHHFFAKTALSKDANEFLLKFHSIEDGTFLLLIPGPCQKNDITNIIEEISYLLELDLYPDILLTELFHNKKELTIIENNLNSKFNDKINIYYSDADNYLDTLTSLAEKKQYFKYLFVHPAFKNSKGIDVTQSHLHNSSIEWHHDANKHLTWIKNFLTHLGPSQSLQVASSAQILPELFTLKGAGTLLSLGYEFLHLRYHEADPIKIISLLEKGFDRKLKDNYQETLNSNAQIILEKNYRGLIILQEVSSMIYLDKITVTPEFLGHGLGSRLLEELFEQISAFTENNPKIFWRATLDNPYREKYNILIDQYSAHLPLKCGIVNDGQYAYHFIGLDSAEQALAIKYMTQRQSSFKT